MSDIKRLGRIIVSMFIIFLITGIIAGTLMIVTVTIFPPVDGVNIPLEIGATIEPLKTSEEIVKMFTVTDFPELISRKNMLPLIVFSIFFGFSVKLVGEHGKVLARVLSSANHALMKMICILMYYAPIGLGAYFAVLIDSFGLKLLGGYARACAIYYPVAFLYFVIFFPIYGYISSGKNGVKALKHLFTPAITSLATQSSVATLPVNLEAAESIGVSEDIRNIVLPIGATTHMDGTCLSGILKISFLFGIFGVPFTGLNTWIIAIILCVITGVAMSGIPGGGLIGEILIVSLYGFPPEAFPIIATIGYLVDPPATMGNSVGDSVVSMLVSRVVEGRDWMKKNIVNTK